jgi:hypothetical protein
LQRGDLWHNNRHGLPAWLLEECGIDRHTLYRALHALEAAGLVRVERKRGSKPAITILECGENGGVAAPEATAPPSKGAPIFDDIDTLRAANLAAMAAMQAERPRRSRRRKTRQSKD